MATIKVRQMRSEDREGISTLMPQFMRDEPVTKAMLESGMLANMDVSHDSRIYMDTFFSSYVNDGVSVVAVDSATGNLVGYRMSAIVTKDKPNALPFSKDDIATRNLAIILEVLADMYRGIDLFARYNVEKYVNFRGVFVSEKYQRKGIAAKMIQKSLDLCREKEIGLVTVEASSAFSSKIFEHLGFEKLVEHNYDSLRVENEILPMSDELKYHKCLALYVLQL